MNELWQYWYYPYHSLPPHLSSLKAGVDFACHFPVMMHLVTDLLYLLNNTFYPPEGRISHKTGDLHTTSLSLSRNCSSFPHFESRRILEIIQPVILENLTARDKLDSAVTCWNPGGERHKADFSEQRTRAPRAVVFQKAPWRPLSTIVGLSKPSSADSESGSAHPLNDDLKRVFKEQCFLTFVSWEAAATQTQCFKKLY